MDGEPVKLLVAPARVLVADPASSACETRVGAEGPDEQAAKATSAGHGTRMTAR
ncbi:MAG: hypothetical protein IT373_35205 [Polyangiaceae bacterium]|nr:hypothetical protein [Polyangiaceae bacterium]